MRLAACTAWLCLLTGTAAATDSRVGERDCQVFLSRLRPGDYRQGLSLRLLSGRAGQGARAVTLAYCADRRHVAGPESGVRLPVRRARIRRMPQSLPRKLAACPDGRAARSPGARVPRAGMLMPEASWP